MRSKLQTIWLPLFLACAALLAIGAAALYASRWDPEVRFCKFAANLKRARAESLHASYTNIAIIYGDSSCAFSIDGDRMLSKFGLPVVNFGLSANMGPLFLSAIAFDSARPGDTVVVALIPELLVKDSPPSDLAAKMGLVLGRPDFVRASNLTGERVHWVANALGLRPGAYYVSTYLVKVLLHKPLYRYREQDIRPCGQYTTDLRNDENETPIPKKADLSAAGVSLLTHLKNWGDAHHVRIVYSLPWHFTDPQEVSALKQWNAGFLGNVEKILPVLKDPTLGVDTNRTDFADSRQHLTPTTALVRSDSLVQALQARDFWTTSELSSLASGAENLRANVAYVK